MQLRVRRWKPALTLGAFALLLLHEPVDDVIDVRVACAETPCKPIPVALRDLFTVGDYLELPFPSRPDHRLNSQSISDLGRETRGLGSVALSRGTVNDFDGHLNVRLSRQYTASAASCPFPSYSHSVGIGLLQGWRGP